MISIYALINHITSLVFYIGATQDPQSRLSYHISCRSNDRKPTHISNILDANLKPEILILDTCEISSVRFWEEYYIDLFKSLGFNLRQMRTSSYPDGKNRSVDVTSVRFPIDMYIALQNEAKNQGLSFNGLIVKILREFVNTLKL